VKLVLKVLGIKFQNHWRWKLNIDIVSMALAWGLQLEDEEDTVKWVMTSFDEEILLGMDSILEWAVPGLGSDISKCYKDEGDAKQYGLIPFIR